MNKKSIFVSILLSILVLGIYVLNIIYDQGYDRATKAYKVYLNGEVIGLIEDKDELYKIIDKEQKEIKEKYNVNNVYPPKGLDIVETHTYDDNFNTANKVYKSIESENNFTIKGYIITLKPKKGNDISIKVLDKKIFEDAVKKLVLSFVTEDELKKFMNGETDDITEIGKVIQNMYFSETITIKEGYISVDDTIYTNVDDLSQYLLFGPDAKMDSYVVGIDDDIESVSAKYKLNPQEFIIANPKYRDVNTMLKVGTKVNVTLLNPVLNFVYEVFKIEETETPYGTKTKTDYSKSPGYSEITTQGVTGLTLNYSKYKVTNGQQDQGITPFKSVVLREAQDQVKTIGPPRQVVTGNYVDIGGSWGWPTNQPSIITSRYGMRKGKLHEGTDISGTGCGSPIYAIADGVVTQTRSGHRTNGTFVVIDHGNGYYSGYLHLSSYQVSVGQTVKRGTRIGSMGQTGAATGCHLHLLFAKGEPFAGVPTQSYDALKTIYKGVK